jgi:hypothetical protein
VIPPGVFDVVSFPDKLQGHVVDPGREPRIHGYAVRADLARHATLLELGWLSLMGELPSEAEREALQLALAWLSPLHVGQGPAHAAVLARVSGAPAEVVPAVAVAALGQWISEERQRLLPLFAWLDGQGEPPEAALQETPTEEDRALYAEIVAASARWFAQPLPASPVLSREAAAYAVLHRLGASDELVLQTLVTWARLPVVMAEACHARPGAVTTYPACLPPYRYVEAP